jgi:hypothetical protein
MVVKSLKHWPLGLMLKTFYFRNLHMFVIGQSFFPYQAVPTNYVYG